MSDKTIILTGGHADAGTFFTYPLNEPESEIRPWRYPDLESFEVVQDGKRVRVIHGGI